jgi:hypothetical protein
MAPRIVYTTPPRPSIALSPHRTKVVKRRKSYTKEFKLSVLDDYHNTFDSISDDDYASQNRTTATQFAIRHGITLKMLFDWIKKEFSIRKQHKNI